MQSINKNITKSLVLARRCQSLNEKKVIFKTKNWRESTMVSSFLFSALTLDRLCNQFP